MKHTENIIKEILQFFKKQRYLLLMLCFTLQLSGCRLLGYNRKVVRPKHHNSNYNHLKDKHKKKTKVYWMKDF